MFMSRRIEKPLVLLRDGRDIFSKLKCRVTKFTNSRHTMIASLVSVCLCVCVCPCKDLKCQKVTQNQLSVQAYIHLLLSTPPLPFL